MRKLTISRNGMGFYGNFGTVKICIEDHGENPDIYIKGVPCRFLGKIKGGENQTFEIGEEELKVFAYMGKSTRNLKYDYRVIPMGTEEVFLSGKSTEERLVGYLFQFDGTTPPDVKEDFGKWKMIMVATFLAALCVGAILGVVLAKVL